MGVLQRITRLYSVVGLFVPVFGVATGARLGVLADRWLIASTALTACAAALLVTAILPAQTRILDAVDSLQGIGSDAATQRLGMLTGAFNLLWATVVVLMIYRPGSTTGAGL